MENDFYAFKAVIAEIAVESIEQELHLVAWRFYRSIRKCLGEDRKLGNVFWIFHWKTIFSRKSDTVATQFNSEYQAPQLIFSGKFACYVL